MRYLLSDLPVNVIDRLTEEQKKIYQEKGPNVKYTFRCSIHGDFERTLSDLIRYPECPSCKRDNAKSLKRVTSRIRATKDAVVDMTEEFAIRAKRGELSPHDKAEFLCKVHGKYFQRIDTHISTGCPKCGHKVGAKKRFLSKRENYDVTDEQLQLIRTSGLQELYDNGRLSFYQPYRIKCSKGHVNETYLDRCKDGCPSCKRELDHKLKAIEKLERIGAKGWSKEFIMNLPDVSRGVPIQFECSIHGIYYKDLDHAKFGCPKCARLRGGVLKAKNIRKVRPYPDWFLKEIQGSPDYEGIINFTIGVDKKITYVCPVHGAYQSTINRHLNQHEGCPKCADRIRADKMSATLREIRGYRNEEYLRTALNFREGMKTYEILEFHCPIHGNYKRTLIAADVAPNCPLCSKAKASKAGSKTLRLRRLGEIGKDKVDEVLSKMVYSEDREGILSGEKPFMDKCTFKCAKGHIYESTFESQYRGGCPVCHRMYTSELEAKMIKALNVRGLVCRQTVRNLIRSAATNRFMELDVVIDEYKVAVEINGLYWHSYQHMQEKGYQAIGGLQNYHLMKTKLCADKGYQLIHLFEDDLIERFDLCVDLVYSKCVASGALDKRKKIYARKTELKKVSPSSIREFMYNNHINSMGSGNSFALFSEGEIVSVMQVKKSSSNTQDAGSWILDRYAEKRGVHVIGGYQKLERHAVEELKIQRMVSYADLEVSNGRLYENNGWKLTAESAPDYSYVYGNKRTHKFNFRIKRFKEDPNLLYEEGLTEFELADLNDIKRIYDCGKFKYEKVFNT